MGLQECDLLQLLARRNHADDPDQLRGRWAFFRIEASDNLYVQSDGLLGFSSSALRSAVGRLFSNNAEYQSFQRFLADYYLSMPNVLPFQV